MPLPHAPKLSTKMIRDQMLRRYGYRIVSRPKRGETLWKNSRGDVLGQADAIADAVRQHEAAKAAKVTTSIDLNYRVKLWTTAEAGKWMSEFMPLCDVLITTEEDTERVFNIKGKDYEEVSAQLVRRFGLKTVAITLRENPLVWKNSWTAMAYQDGKVFKTRTEAETAARRSSPLASRPIATLIRKLVSTYAMTSTSCSEALRCPALELFKQASPC